MSGVGMYLYPWDVVVEGPERVVEQVAELGVTSLHIATAYHSAEVLAPRRSEAVLTTAEANRVHTPLPAGTFTDLSLPGSAIATGHPDLFERLRDVAASAGISLGCWAVTFHNSELATTRPDAAILNCFGDRFTHGLCPANPAARTYAVELVRGLAGTGLFDRMFVESVSYLLYGHGHPHELWGARFDATTRYLVSLCFCEHCVRTGAERGVDVAGLRARVAAELDRAWNAGYPVSREADDGAELASLLLNWPDLAEYTRMRMDTVTSLIAELADVSHAAGLPLDVSAAVWGRPAPRNWIEGVDVSRTLELADRFVLESYFPSVAEVAAELDHVRALAAPLGDAAAELAVILTVWPAHHSSVGDLLAKVETVRAGGASALGFYNYGTATRTTLGWVGEAARAWDAR